MSIRRIGGWGVVVMAGIFFWMWIRGGLPNIGMRQPEALIGKSERQLAPELLVHDLEGRSVQIQDGRREPILLLFWASW